MPQVQTIEMTRDVLRLLDQTRLPLVVDILECRTVAQVRDAICRLVVRGAPAIGIAAAYGVCLAGGSSGSFSRRGALDAIESLASSRPTAVNLFWALQRMKQTMESVSLEGETLRERLLTEAITIHDEDRLMCRKIGELGATLLANCTSILTHCNAGGLATSERGTALAPIYQLHEWGKTLHVFADETRPLMQGARLTAWELSQAGIPVTVCTDSMAGSLMRQGRVESVIVGADRIAVCGDVANKIGTYPLAVLARFHGIPFYVAAPSNTFDLSLASGDEIPIEQRATTEITVPFGCPLPPNVQATNYAFDVTPATLVSAFITERGVIHSPNASKITELIGFGNK